MSKRSFVAGFVLTLVLLSTLSVSVGSAASMSMIKSSNPQPQASTNASGTLAYREYWCRRVTAVDISIFSTSTSTTPIGKFYQGQRFATTGIANNRYHIYDPDYDVWYGWVTADPRWSDFIGYYCAE